jgi:hypothetical protein
MKQRTALMKRWMFLNYVFEVVLLVIFNLCVDSISRITVLLCGIVLCTRLVCLPLKSYLDWITVLLCGIVLCTRLVCWLLKSYPNWITLYLMRNAFSYVSQSSEMQYIVTAEFISNLTRFPPHLTTCTLTIAIISGQNLPFSYEKCFFLRITL